MMRTRRWGVAALLLIALVIPLVAACTGEGEVHRQAAALTGGDPGRGKASIRKYGCDTCHTIPGIETARGLVGPSLAQVASRVYLAGRLTNTPGNMIRWIQHPQQVDPGQVMPEMGVSEREARDIAAYLYTLR
jgi:cytochrome c